MSQCDHNAHVFAPPCDIGQSCRCGATRLMESAKDRKVVDLDAVRREQEPHFVIETGANDYDSEPLTVHVVPLSVLLDYAHGRADIDGRVLRRIVVEWAGMVSANAAA